MAQVLSRYCPRCGAPVVIQSRFCATCSLPVEAMLSRTTKAQSTQDNQYDQDLMSPGDQQASQRVPHVQQSYPHYEPQTFQVPVEPSSTPRRRSMGRKGCMLLLVVILVLLSVAGYISAGLLGVHLPGFGSARAPVITTAINASVRYAGVDITIKNAQQSQSFANDPNAGTNGVVRLNLREQNNTGIKVGWSYAEVARLILPNKTIVSPTYINAVVEIAPGTSQTSVVDFAVPSNVRIDQLTLQLGATKEAHMLIPLTGKVNVSRYLSKTIKLHGQMQYFGLNWSLISATSSWSIAGEQATNLMRYVIVTLKVDNTLSQVAITGSPYDYIRLKFGNTTVSPKQTTLPVSFYAGASGQVGTVAFLAPLNTKSFTLVLLPQPQSGSNQAMTDFQLSS